MAGRFEGLRDLEWRLFADIFPPDTTETRPWDAACTFSDGMAYFALRFDDRLSLVRGPTWATMGVEERDASLVAALAGGWHPGRDASADFGDC